MPDTPQRPTPEEAERELRRRLREDWITPEHRRWLRQWLVIGKGRNRYKTKWLERLSNEQLWNNWAAAPPQHPDKLVDLSDLPDRQLLRAALQHDIGRAGDKEVLSDSAIAELAKRANAARLTVADYVRRRIGPFDDE
jgi:hypothetical protein